MATQENLTEVYNKLVTDVEVLQEQVADSIRELMAIQATNKKTTWVEVGNLVAIKNKLQDIGNIAKAEVDKLRGIDSEAAE